MNERTCRHCGFPIELTSKIIREYGFSAHLCFDNKGCHERKKIQCCDVRQDRCELGAGHPYKHWNPMDGHWGEDRHWGRGKKQ